MTKFDSNETVLVQVDGAIIVSSVSDSEMINMKSTPNRTTNDKKKSVVRKVTPEPHIPIFGSVDDNDAMNKPTKRTRYSLWNDRNIIQKPNLSYLCPQENNSAVVTKTSRALASIPKPFYTNFSAEELKKLYTRGLGQPDPAVNVQQAVNQSHFDFSVIPMNSKTLTLREFLALWDECLLKFGTFKCTEDIERQHTFREASLKCNAANQDTAHYGRTRFEACQKIFKLTGLKRNEIFLDLGHGIGNAPILAAATVGCESRGLELVKNRFSLSSALQRNFCTLLKKREKEAQKDFILGKIDLRQGDFCDKGFRPFITEADVILVNNAFEIFAARSQSRTSGASLDDHIAGIFAQMKPGSRMVTLYPLPLGLSLSDANNQKKKLGFPKNENASFFECRIENLGVTSVSWTNKETLVYIYTRTINTVIRDNPSIAMFTCENVKCQTVARVLCETTGLLIKNCAICMGKRSVTGIRKAARSMKLTTE